MKLMLKSIRFYLLEIHQLKFYSEKALYSLQVVATLISVLF
jgi:hypothetical protein